MPFESPLVEYYRARAAEYESVYAKPERQGDLAVLHGIIPAFFAGRRILEVACGTGYWTRLLAAQAASVIAIDLAPETLRLAKARQPNAAPVEFREGDAFDLTSIDGVVDAGFAGFWWSHIPRCDLRRFLTGLHRRLPAGSPVLLLDNRYVEGSNWPISRIDADGNTYQRRRLENGAEHDVLKNFPAPHQVQETIIESGGADPVVIELAYYWYVTYSNSDDNGNDSQGNHD